MGGNTTGVLPKAHAGALKIQQPSIDNSFVSFYN
jgi:hypothetical protein